MKPFHSNHSKSTQKRLVYQQTSPNENISQKADDNLAKVSETVKESYGARLEMKDKLEKMAEPISKEKEQYSQLVLDLKAKFAADPSLKEAQGSFDCLGKKVTVTMTADGVYQEFVDQKPIINFLIWAIDTKKHQKEVPNA